jgi:hypothetical protein
LWTVPDWLGYEELKERWPGWLEVAAFDGGSVGRPGSIAERRCEMAMARKRSGVGLLDELLQRICRQRGARGGGAKPGPAVAVSVGGDGLGSAVGVLAGRALELLPGGGGPRAGLEWRSSSVAFGRAHSTVEFSFSMFSK